MNPAHDIFAFRAHGRTIRMRLPNASDHLQRLVRTRGRFYEDQMLETVGCTLPEDACVVDVGANIGNHTLFWSAVAGARIIAFEPNPKALTLLRSNLELNDLAGRVELHAVALGSRDGRGDVVDCNPLNMGTATVAHSGHGEIEIRRLDDVIGQRHIDLIKIDVEGMEVEVLRGAQATLRRCRPILLIEAATLPHLQAIDAELQPEGYRKRRVFNDTPTYEYVHEPVQGDVGHVAGRLPSPVRARLPATEAIVAGMATVAGNETALRAAVMSLLPQVDRLYLYLNRYQEVPAFLRANSKIIACTDTDGTRFGDAGKFWGLAQSPASVYLTCDDDIVYPPDYAARLATELAACDGQAIVGVHGALIHQPCRGYYDDGSRSVIHFEHALIRRRRVHVVGTGTAAFHSDVVRMTLDDFKHPNMADIWLARYAQQRGLPLFAVPRPERWLVPLEVLRPTIYQQSSSRTGSAYDNARPQDEVLTTMYPVSLLDADTPLSVRLLHVFDGRDSANGFAEFLAAIAARERDPIVMAVCGADDIALREAAARSGAIAEWHLIGPGNPGLARYRVWLGRSKLAGWRVDEEGELLPMSQVNVQRMVASLSATAALETA